MAEATFDAIITIDEAGRIIEFSAGAEAVFGFRSADVLGRPVSELIIPPHLRERHEKGLQHYLASGERHLPRRCVQEGMRADGSTFPVELSVAEVCLERRRLFTAHLRDITERQQAEQALLDSERRFRAIIEDQTDCICRYDSEFRLTFSNRAYARLFEAEPETLLGQDLFVGLAPEAKTALRAALLALTPENPTYTSEDEGVYGHGEVRTLAWIDRALFDDAGHCLGYQCVGRDITKAKQDQAALQAAATELAVVADGVPLAIVISRIGRPEILFANCQARSLLGLHTGCSPEQITAAYEDPADRERLFDLVKTVGRIEGLEMSLRRPDGSTIRALISARAIQFHGVPAVLAATTDITARLHVEQALRASEMRLAAFMQHAPVGMYLKDLEGRYVMLNPEMANVFRRPAEAVIGRTPEDVFPPDEAAMIRSYDREALATGTATVKEEFLSGLDQYAWSMVIRFPVRDESGRVVQIGGFDVDITNQKRAEAEFRRQREALHQRERLAALGSLLAGVAHELNNPLAVVLGRAIMLEEDVVDPAVRESLGRLRAAAERCARIVRSFLALARQKPRESKPIDVRLVLDAALEILASNLRSSGAEIIREDMPGLPLVIGDEDELHQVFLNLIVNAMQALEARPLASAGSSEPRRLWIGTGTRSEDGAKVVAIEIADNGPGIPPLLRRQIFDPFFTTKPSGTGTGLGLSVCHRIVVDHGGTIGADERPGGGARFLVTLPAWHAGLDQPASAPSIMESNGGDILVVDDEAEVVLMLEELLQKEGHRVATAPDGAVALELMRDRRFDAILCDFRMPLLDGPGLAQVLATTRPELVDRLLFMTGDVLRATAALPPNLCAQVLEKPLDPNDVRQRVRELLAQGR